MTAYIDACKANDLRTPGLQDSTRLTEQRACNPLDALAASEKKPDGFGELAYTGKLPGLGNEECTTRKRKSRPNLDSTVYLSTLPEVEANIDLRYDFLLLGSAAEQVCRGLAGHSVKDTDAIETPGCQKAPLALLCEVPGTPSDQDEGSGLAFPRKARVRCRSFTRFLDDVPHFANSSDAFNAAAFFVVHLDSDGQVQTDDKKGDGQMWLLNAMARQYFFQPVECLACLNALLVLQDPTDDINRPLPAEVEAFRERHKLELIVVPLDPSGSSAKLFQMAEAAAAHLPEWAAEKERAFLETERASPTKDKCKGKMAFSSKVRAMLLSAGLRISGSTTPGSTKDLHCTSWSCSSSSTCVGSISRDQSLERDWSPQRSPSLETREVVVPRPCGRLVEKPRSR